MKSKTAKYLVLDEIIGTLATSDFNGNLLNGLNEKEKIEVSKQFDKLFKKLCGMRDRYLTQTQQ